MNKAKKTVPLKWYRFGREVNMRKFLRNNGLSVVFVLLFMFSLTGQIYTGLAEHNKDRTEDGQSPVELATYLHSGHFIQATFENWESEFLQMALFVVLTISLRQKGSSESKAMEGEKKWIASRIQVRRTHHGR